jgi:LemA protein
MVGFGLIVFLGVLFLASAVLFFNAYNGLVRLRTQVERAWANIDVILKQRYDEIPQLIQVVEQYTGYEAGILHDLAAARANYGQAGSVAEKITASGQVSHALRGILAIGEAYPELRSNQNFVQLQSRISQLETSLSDRREVYNESVANFNARIEQVPDVFAARILGYTHREMFHVSENERATPNLKMSLPSFRKGA